MSWNWTEHRERSLYRSCDSSDSQDLPQSSEPWQRDNTHPRSASPSSADSLYVVPSPPTLRRVAAMPGYTSLGDIPPFSLNATRPVEDPGQRPQCPSPLSAQTYQHRFSPSRRVVNADRPRVSTSTTGMEDSTDEASMAEKRKVAADVARGPWCSPYVAGGRRTSSASSAAASSFPPKGRVWAGEVKLPSCHACVMGWKMRHLHDEEEEEVQRMAARREEEVQRAMAARREEEVQRMAARREGRDEREGVYRIGGARREGRDEREGVCRMSGAGIVQRDGTTTWVEDVRVLGYAEATEQEPETRAVTPATPSRRTSVRQGPYASRVFGTRVQEERLRVCQHGARRRARGVQQGEEGAWESVELSEDEWVEVGRVV